MRVATAELRTYRWSGPGTGAGSRQGIVYAASERDAKLDLYSRGVTVTRLRRVYRFAGSGSGVGTKELVHFLYQLSIVVQCGVSISPALEITTRTSEHKGLQAMITKIRYHVEHGLKLSEALSRYPRDFDITVRALISAGEQSGTFAFMLARAAHHLRRTHTLRKELQQALFYPMLVGGLSILVIAALMIEVVPAFAHSFSAFDVQLPLLTQYVIVGSDYVQDHWLAAAIVMTAAALALRWLRHAPAVQLVGAHAVRYLPLLAPLLRETCLARFCMVAANTLEAKIPITESLRLAGAASGDLLIAREAEMGAQKLGGAVALHAWMANSKQFPPLLVHMLQVGESSGRLVDTLNFLTEHYEEQIKYRAHRLGVLVEPLMMLVLGVFVGVLILAMYLPIFELGSIF